MICNNCGAEIPADSIFCLNCGARVKEQPQNMQTEVPPQNNILHYYDPNGFSLKLRKQLASPLFLVICILLTAASVPVNGLPILTILFAIASWITYSNAKKDTPVMEIGGLKFISGTMTASYIVNWVAFGLMVFSSVTWLIFLPFVIMAESEISAALNAESFMVTYNEMLVDVYGEEFARTVEGVLEQYYNIIEFIYSNFVLVFIIAAVFLVVYTVALGIYNGVFYSRFKKLAKGIPAAYVSGDWSKLKFKGVSGLLMATGIIRLVIDFINLVAFTGTDIIFSACLSVTFILASMWVKQLAASLAEGE